MLDLNRAFVAPAHRLLAVFAATLFAAACGGGGDDGGGDTATERAASSAEGFYTGTLTGGTPTRFQMLVLENNEFWIIYGTQSATGSSFLIESFMQGTGSHSAGTYTSTAMRDFGAAPTTAGTFNASFKINSASFVTSVSGTANAGARNLAIAGNDNVLDFLYRLPAAASDVAGSWTVSLSTGETATLAVTAAGTLTANTSRGCSGSGSMTPRASGKNVFNLTLVFGAAPCVFPGATFSGVAYSYPLLPGSRRQLTAAARNTAQSAGLLLVGTR